MFNNLDELIKTTAINIKQNKLNYQPEALNALYYIDYAQNKNVSELADLKANLQKEAQIIREISNIEPQDLHTDPSGSNLTIWISKKELKSGQTPEAQIIAMGEDLLGMDHTDYLLLDNQLLAEIKAPYRTVLLDSTIDLAKNYDKFLVPKNNHEATIINLYKQIGQCLVLININDGSCLTALPATAILKYPDQKMIKEKYQLTEDVPPLYGSLYNESRTAKPKLKSNCISVTVREIERVVKPMELVQMAGLPLNRLNVDDFYFSEYSGFSDYNFLIGDYNYQPNTEQKLRDMQAALTNPVVTDTEDWRAKMGWLFKTTATDYLRGDLGAYLDMEIIWEIDQEGNFKIKTIDHLSYWDKILAQYQTNDLAHLQEHFKDCNQELGNTADMDLVFNIFNQGFLESHLRSKRQLYKQFTMPKTTDFQVEPVKLIAKTQTVKQLKPLMPAKGMNSIIKDLNNSKGLVFYDQKHLFNFKKRSINKDDTALIVKEVKL